MKEVSQAAYSIQDEIVDNKKFQAGLSGKEINFPQVEGMAKRLEVTEEQQASMDKAREDFFKGKANG